MIRNIQELMSEIVALFVVVFLFVFRVVLRIAHMLGKIAYLIRCSRYATRSSRLQHGNRDDDKADRVGTCCKNAPPQQEEGSVALLIPAGAKKKNAPQKCEEPSCSFSLRTRAASSSCLALFFD
jgi:hypothetical protein